MHVEYGGSNEKEKHKLYHWNKLAQKGANIPLIQADPIKH